jgi:hypothetical protein
MQEFLVLVSVTTRTDDGGGKHLWNFLIDYTVQHPVSTRTITATSRIKAKQWW